MSFKDLPSAASRCGLTPSLPAAVARSSLGGTDMRNPLATRTGQGLALALAAAGLTLAAAPAFAQPAYPATVDEVTVYGRLGTDGRPATLSRVDENSDLDLRD